MNHSQAVIKAESRDESGTLVRWTEGGTPVEILGQTILLGGRLWTPVRFLNESEPAWVRECALQRNS